ncbi:hypothetical protein DdX_11560 [Ditylenchus destructor]|uniref:Uncharacterized protein n=1 Tax=Ditylenchus destructor TaxID=166010 RepID=A0AAD4MXQ9_9BILA|nr:hypothetical protein DdX_11560 [Ditylenchus destructor]
MFFLAGNIPMFTDHFLNPYFFLRFKLFSFLNGTLKVPPIFVIGIFAALPLNSTTNTTRHNLAFDKWGLIGSSETQLNCAACCRTCAVPYELRCLPRRDRAAAALRSPAAYLSHCRSAAALLNGQHRLNQFSGFHSGLTNSPGFHSGITNSPGLRSGLPNFISIRPDFTPVNDTLTPSSPGFHSGIA